VFNPQVSGDSVPESTIDYGVEGGMGSVRGHVGGWLFSRIGMVGLGPLSRSLTDFDRPLSCRKRCFRVSIGAADRYIRWCLFWGPPTRIVHRVFSYQASH